VSADPRTLPAAPAFVLLGILYCRFCRCAMTCTVSAPDAKRGYQCGTACRRTRPLCADWIERIVERELAGRIHRTRPWGSNPCSLAYANTLLTQITVGATTTRDVRLHWQRHRPPPVTAAP
jgi:hypothetical protein